MSNNHLTEEINRLKQLAGILKEDESVRQQASEFISDEIEDYNRQVGGFLPRSILNKPGYLPQWVTTALTPEEIEEIYSDVCHSIAGH